MNNLRNLFIEKIETHTLSYAKCLKDYIICNQQSPIISSEFSEMIGALINNTSCCGTGGSGWDNQDGGECKHCDHIQPKFCAECGMKNIFFRETCNHCNSKSFKQIKSLHS